MYRKQQRLLRERLRSVLQAKYQVELPQIAIEQPPDLEMGSMRCRWLSSWPAGSNDRRARSPGNWSRDLMPLEGFASFAVAGAGYINGKLDRQAAARQIARDDAAEEQSHLHSLVEHTSINPNKAAHIGHLRNAILGDTFVRLLRAAGQRVDVQNYIDNTGVQVADMVVGLTHLEGYDLAGVSS